MIRFFADDAKQITDLTFIGDAIDLPYYDFVVGVEPLSEGTSIAYNNGEGEALKSHLLSLIPARIQRWSKEYPHHSG